MAAVGAVAAGHIETARAAAAILEEGGNAFDAALAALCTACVAEPVLVSLGGGGFLMARPSGAAPVLYDFFAQTPRRRRPAAEVDVRAVRADFGTRHQEFHIGMGAIAVPGLVAALFRIQRDLGRMPMARLVEPAIGLARTPSAVEPLQARIIRVVAPIYLAGAAARRLFESRARPGEVIGEGETFANPQFAGFLESLAREGPALFYRGAAAQALIADCRVGGGHLGADDLAAYRVRRRAPLALDYGPARLFLNPPPSAGGGLIAAALARLDSAGMARLRFAGAAHARRLARALAGAAHDAGRPARPAARRGTTHISVVDAAGNAAALSASNGEGAGYVLPGTGIMMNNMLGEDDINPDGLHRWPEGVRMASMMAPTLALHAGARREIALGSGGSKRIRTAIPQVLVNMIAFAMDAERAVASPRLHAEDESIDVEPGFATRALRDLESEFRHVTLWPEPSFYFGGVHCVDFDARGGRFAGAGDARRGGVFLRAGGPAEI